MADKASTADTIQKVVSMGGLAFGVGALLAPEALARSYGIHESSANFRLLTRLWGTRTALLGGLLLTAGPGASRRRLLGAASAMNGVDAFVALTSKGLPARTKMSVAATSAAFAAAGAFVLSNGAE